MKCERELMEGIKLPSQKRIRTLGETDNYMYLGILEADTMKHAEMEKKNKKRVSQTNEKTSRSQAWKRNIIKEINT